MHYLKSDEANLAAAHPASAAAMVSKEGYYSKKLYEAVCQNDIDTIKSCLDNGADVNYVETDFQVSVLHVACFESRNDILRMLIINNVNLIGKDKNSGQTVIDLLQETLREYLENYPKSKYIYSAPTLKRFEAQHSVLKFLNEFVHGKPTIKNLKMPIIYCSTDKNYCYVGFQASSTHKHMDLWQCYGACEWEIRSTSIGSATDKIYSTTFDVIFETVEQRNGNEDFLQSMLKPKFGKKIIAYPSDRHVAEIEPGYNYIVRCRYVHKRYEIATAWSQFSKPCMYPKEEFVQWLRSYGLENYIAEFGKHDMYSIRDLQMLDRETFEHKFKHSGMDFRQRRLLWLGVQSSMRKKSRIDVTNHALSGKADGGSQIAQNHAIEKTETPLFEFLQDIGLERYHDGIEILVETLDILKGAYSNQEELISDIKEVLPEMKPPHRRLLWKGVLRLNNEKK